MGDLGNDQGFMEMQQGVEEALPLLRARRRYIGCAYPL